MPGAKNWVFTLNNFTEEDQVHLQNFGDNELIRYLVFGRESGERGTPHLQGYISWRDRRSLDYCRNAISPRAHFEVMRGTPAQASVYCKKEGDFEEFGELPGGRGSRSDLQSALVAVKSGISRVDLIEQHSLAYARAGRMLSEYQLLNAPGRDWETFVSVYWGETGIGKTRKAFEEAARPYIHPGGSWFDGYDGHSDVIFDDFGGSEFKITYLLKLLDRYQMRVPIKGGFVQWVPRKIWITSNYSPDAWFPNAKDEHVRALKRRFSKVVRFRRLSSVLAVDDAEEELCFPGQ